MDKKKLQISLILCLSLGAALFVALLLIASFFDLEISRALTKGSLDAGKYYSHNGFAVFFEAVGFSVLYLSGALASLICVSAAIKMNDGDPFLFLKELSGLAYKIIRPVIAVGFSAFGVYETYCFVHEPLKYAEKYLTVALDAKASFTLESGYLIAAQAVFAIILSALVLTLLLRVKKESLFRLVRLAILMFLAELFYLIVIDAIKTPVGRMRFRTMNVIGDFSYYTPWYKINGARHVLYDGSVVSGGLDGAALVGAASDTCKSFPSGHTYGAAMSFALVCLPDLFERFKKKYIKALCWIIPAVYTVTVAITRIVVGAHYFSDVLVGGTLAFTLIMIIREVLILNCAHFRAFKKDEESNEKV